MGIKGYNGVLEGFSFRHYSLIERERRRAVSITESFGILWRIFNCSSENQLTLAANILTTRRTIRLFAPTATKFTKLSKKSPSILRNL